MDAIVDFLAMVGLGMFLWILICIAIAVVITRKNSQPPKNPRHEANLQILAQLLKYVDDNPDQRFGQILRNTGVVWMWELEIQLSRTGKLQSITGCVVSMKNPL